MIMKKNYTRKQITDAIQHWSSILESMNETEVLDEGFFKRARDKVKDAAKASKEGLKNAVSGAAEKIHDTFAANEGMKMLGTAMGKAKKEGKKEADLKFSISLLPDLKGNAAGFGLWKKNKLVIQFSEKEDTKLGPAELKKFLQDKGIQKNVSSSIDGIMCCISEKDKKSDEKKFVDFENEADIEGDMVFMWAAKVKKVALDNDVITITFDKSASSKKKDEDDANFWN